MKKYSIYLIVLFMWSCAKDQVSDCIQASGDLVVKEYDLDAFNRILVHENIELIIKMGSEHQLSVAAGEFLISDVTYTIREGLLTLSDNNQCNWVRSYTPTKIIVTTPTLTEIRSNTQHPITCDGTLTFPNLNLISENFNQDNISSGDFNLEVQSESLKIVSNNVSQFFISGNTEHLDVGFYAGTTAFFGADLVARHIKVYHRSSHDMIVNPQESLTGQLRSVGDLISIQRPSTVDVRVLYTGDLIFLN